MRWQRRIRRGRCRSVWCGGVGLLGEAGLLGGVVLRVGVDLFCIVGLLGEFGLLGGVVLRVGVDLFCIIGLLGEAGLLGKFGQERISAREGFQENIYI